MFVQGNSGWLPPRWGPKELHCGPSCAHRTACFLAQIAFWEHKSAPREVIGHMRPVRCRKFLYFCEYLSFAFVKLTTAMGHCLVWTPNSWHPWCKTCLSNRSRCQLFEFTSTLWPLWAMQTRCKNVLKLLRCGLVATCWA